ncbi:hypothetical protein GOODEAATRI_004032, partial [Goodea atripinnis]
LRDLNASPTCIKTHRSNSVTTLPLAPEEAASRRERLGGSSWEVHLCGYGNNILSKDLHQVYPTCLGQEHARLVVPGLFPLHYEAGTVRMPPVEPLVVLTCTSRTSTSPAAADVLQKPPIVIYRGVPSVRLDRMAYRAATVAVRALNVSSMLSAYQRNARTWSQTSASASSATQSRLWGNQWG